MKPSEISKAIAGYLVPAIVILGASLLPDSPGGVGITLQEWIAIAVAGLSTGTVVYAVPNKKRVDS